uniref:Uncharacterized protein n=1 Tax=Anguilla anguilla TaxID=7936 RepID=A0A0E9SZU7_ANGAN
MKIVATGSNKTIMIQQNKETGPIIVYRNESK